MADKDYNSFPDRKWATKWVVVVFCLPTGVQEGLGCGLDLSKILEEVSWRSWLPTSPGVRLGLGSVGVNPDPLICQGQYGAGGWLCLAACPVGHYVVGGRNPEPAIGNKLMATQGTCTL